MIKNSITTTLKTDCVLTRQAVAQSMLIIILSAGNWLGQKSSQLCSERKMRTLWGKLISSTVTAVKWAFTANICDGLQTVSKAMVVWCSQFSSVPIWGDRGGRYMDREAQKWGWFRDGPPNGCSQAMTGWSWLWAPWQKASQARPEQLTETSSDGFRSSSRQSSGDPLRIHSHPLPKLYWTFTIEVQALHGSTWTLGSETAIQDPLS